MNQRYLVELVTPSGHRCFRFRSERCKPIDGEYPEEDVINSKLATPTSQSGPPTAQSEETKSGPPGLSSADVQSLCSTIYVLAFARTQNVTTETGLGCSTFYHPLYFPSHRGAEDPQGPSQEASNSTF